MTGPKIRALIVDDEPPARRKLRTFLEPDPEVEIVGEAASGAGAIEQIRALRPDLVFLDIQLGEIDGFGVLEALDGEPLPQVVFVTAYDEHAIRAFDVSAVDYLLKPFDVDRFADALTRAKQRLQTPEGPFWQRVAQMLDEALERPKTGRLMVKKRGRAVLLRTDDIGWIRAAGNYVELHVGDEEHLLRETLEGIRQRLSPSTFLRVHRSYLVHIDHIREIRPATHGDYRILTEDGREIPLSRRYRDRLPEDLATDL